VDAETGGGAQRELLLLSASGWLTRYVLLPPPPQVARAQPPPAPSPPQLLGAFGLQPLARWSFRGTAYSASSPVFAEQAAAEEAACEGGDPLPAAAEEGLPVTGLLEEEA